MTLWVIVRVTLPASEVLNSPAPEPTPPLPAGPAGPARPAVAADPPGPPDAAESLVAGDDAVVDRQRPARIVDPTAKATAAVAPGAARGTICRCPGPRPAGAALRRV